MAVAANLEWKLETALIAVLSAWADLAGVTVRRRYAIDAAIAYPVVVVSCTAAEDADFAVTADYSRAYCDLFALTDLGTDTTGESVGTVLGAVRDALYAPALATRLTNAVSGLTVYGVEIAMSDAQPVLHGRFRQRRISLVVHASAQDI